MAFPSGAWQRGKTRPAAVHAGRAGVTLNEILFAIMVMGVGLLSVLSLFPIGLLNVARAVQNSRAAAYADGALGDLQVRRLLGEERYRFGPVNPLVGPGNPLLPPLPSSPRLNNPFIVDHGHARVNILAGGAWDNQIGFALPGERGLPVAIDPLWMRAFAGTTPPVAPQHRLGVLSDGTGNVATDGAGNPLNWGLQRVLPTDAISTDGDRLIDAVDDPTGVGADGVAEGYPDDFDPSAPFAPISLEFYLPQSLAQRIFASRDDIAFQETEETDFAVIGDEAEVEKRWLPLYGPPLPPNFVTTGPPRYGEPMREQKYSSLVTAYLPDAGDPTRYEVSQAVFFNRELPPPFGIIGLNVVPPGERTVLAYYLPQPGEGANSLNNVAIPVQPSNQVILMWLANEPAPEVPREGWFLDASYDANAAQWSTANGGPGREFWPHRAFWYRIVDRGEPQVAGAAGSYLINGNNAVRQLITLDRPVREVTYLRTAAPTPVTYPLPPSNSNFSPIDAGPIDPIPGGTPMAVNVAVLFPGLVNVYERTLTVPKP